MLTEQEKQNVHLAVQRMLPSGGAALLTTPEEGDVSEHRDVGEAKRVRKDFAEWTDVNSSDEKDEFKRYLTAEFDEVDHRQILNFWRQKSG